jgi:hypothetical protein
VSLVNDGRYTWYASGGKIFRLGISFGGTGDDPHDGWATDQRFFLPHDVLPGEHVTVNVSVSAPSVPGTYCLRHWLVWEDALWFPVQHKVAVAVR